MSGRAEWIGWFELEREPVAETAINNTARVIDCVKADVQCVIEAEDRPGLVRFNEEVMPLVNAQPFEHIMLVDGNDDRGIDVGIMARNGCVVGNMRSHVDDADADGKIFSRDCAEYEIAARRRPAGRSRRARPPNS